jgi:hypothetical protein
MQFAAAEDYPVGALPDGVSAVDLDGDGHLDLVATCMFAGTLSVLVVAPDWDDRLFVLRNTRKDGSLPLARACCGPLPKYFQLAPFCGSSPD